MKYLPNDFTALSVLSKQNTATVETLWQDFSYAVCAPITLPCVASVLTALAEGGYLTVAADCLTPHTEVTLTEKGRAAVAIGGLTMLFAGARIRAERKNMYKFCSLSRPDVPPMAWEPEAFSEEVYDAAPSAEIPSLFTVGTAEDGTYTVTFSYEKYNEEDIPTEAVILYCDRDALRRILSDLLDTALLLSENRKTRKAALHGVGRSYVLTFSTVADESDDYRSVQRMTIAPILFNRQRFIGKRDSDLDYAQCGENLVTRTDMDGADIYYAAMLRPDLLDGELGEKMDALYQKVNP